MRNFFNQRLSMMIVNVLILCMLFPSCKDDNGDGLNISSDNPENYDEFKDWYETLFDTSWMLQSSTRYSSSGEVKDLTIISHSYEEEIYSKYLSTVITFTSNFLGHYYVLLWSTGDGDGEWEITDDQELVLLDSYHCGNPSHISATEVGIKTRFFPIVAKIDICTSDKLVLSDYTEYGSKYEYVFKRVYGIYNGSGNNSGTVTESVEDFYETNFSSTEYSDKITVNFYFSDRVSSAIIKYGTTSSCSSSKTALISAKSAYVTVTGLKSGTKYYFKCEAKSSSGQSYTTGTYTVMTN